METAKITQPISGDKLYQIRARKALPILVREARARKAIYYHDLARKLDMPNPRNLNYVLGSIGKSLDRLSQSWKEKVPAIQCIVVNQAKELPGEGVGWFITKRKFRDLSRAQQRALVKAEHQKVFAYRRWGAVLSALGLDTTNKSPPALQELLSEELIGLEGERREHMVAHRHREVRLRKRKIEHVLRYGNGRLVCEVPGCGFDFLRAYGELGEGYAQVHHLRPLSAYKRKAPTKLVDLAIVCANCHAMIHRGGQCRELGALIPR